jgi:hypothetical protein
MKKKLLYVGAFLLTVAMFNSCDLLGETCQDCAINFYDGAEFKFARESAEYCDEDLILFKAAPDYTDITTGYTAKAECE